MDVRVFRKLMKEIIEDTKLIPSEALATKLFVKTMDGTAVLSKSVPKRIVKQIAQHYVDHNHFTQDDLASIYVTRRETISAILKRAIAENIVDDITAEKIVVQIRSHCKSVDAYSAAFDKRAKLKEQQA